jgi:hypothetical protein
LPHSFAQVQAHDVSVGLSINARINGDSIPIVRIGILPITVVAAAAEQYILKISSFHFSCILPLMATIDIRPGPLNIYTGPSILYILPGNSLQLDYDIQPMHLSSNNPVLVT